MGEPPPGTPREEAERLVVAALATMSVAARGWLARAGAGHPLATETGGCCVCPVCRAIAAVRDPSPDLVERLASGAADVAAGVTTLLRAFDTTLRPPPQRPAPEEESGAGEEPVPPRTARTAVRKVVPKGDPPRSAGPDNGGAAG